MALSDELVSAFVKVTNDQTEIKQEATVYGTIVEHDGTKYVRLDGSDLLTPIDSTADANAGERVTVLIKNHTATVTGNASSPAARKGSVEEIGDQITQVEILVADKVSTKQLDAANARIDNLVAEDVLIRGELTAQQATISELEAENVTISGKLTSAEASIENLETTKLDAEIADVKYATVENLNAANADIYNLEATHASFVEATTKRLNAVDANIDDLSANKLDANTADITYAKIADLDATNAEIDKLDANVADIDTLIFGSASGNTIQTSFANAVIAMLGDAQIKSAMIESISAGKITAGDILTNKVRVMSEDGKLLISDETIQISDSSRVRVQIGKDAANDYSINIWDADGNLMFSEGGITDNAIKEAIIRNDMVSDDANISAHKLNIDSLFEEINGSSKTIKATKVYFDDKKQTLDVAFTGLTTDVSDTKNTVSSQGTAISVIQGQISSKIWQQDIDTAVGDIEDATDTLTSQYSTLEQEIDGIAATVASHTTELDAVTGDVTAVNNKVAQLEIDLDGISTMVSAHTEQISNKADNTTVTEVTNKVTKVEQDLEGFRVTVGDTYATKEELSVLPTTSGQYTSIVTINNAMADCIDKIHVFGRTVQNGTPTPEAPVELVSPGDDGNVEVTVSGKNLVDLQNTVKFVNNIASGIPVTETSNSLTISGATSKTWASRRYIWYFPAGIYTLSAKMESDKGVCNLPVYSSANLNSGYKYQAGLTASGSISFTLAESCYLEIRPHLTTDTSTGGETWTTRYYDIQIERGRTATGFVEANNPILTVSTPNGLPGIPVPSDGNYTDASGQQWICDEIDFARGKYIQRVASYVPPDNQFGVAESNGYPVGGSLFFRKNLPNANSSYKYALCSKLPCNTGALSSDINGFYVSASAAYCRIKGVSDLTEFHSLMNGAEFYYILATPIETYLSAEELLAYSELRNEPGTVHVISDGALYVELSGMASSKRISSAEAAIKMNSEAIELSATKKEVSENHYTKTETDAKFKVTNDSISMTVKEEIDNLHIGSVNEIRNSDDLIFENYYFTGDFIVTHNGNGNVTVVCGASVTYDENGNVTMRSATTTTHDGAGNVTTK